MWIRARTPKLHRSCGGQFSFYRDLIGRYWAGGANEITAAPIHRLCTLARKMHVRSIIIEDAHDRSEIQAEIAHLEAWGDRSDGEVTAVSVSFLTLSKPRSNNITRPIDADQLIGQATLITFPTSEGFRSFVHEAAFRLPRSGHRAPQLLLNNYVPVARRATVLVGGCEIEIDGSVFHQQNGVTSVCVHSTVRSLLRNLAGIRATTEDLNTLWGFRGGRHNVDSAMVVAAFRQYGLRAVTYDLTDRNAPIGTSIEDTTWRTMTCLAESATSAILGFEPVGPASHIIGVIGFTLNTDEWLPHAAPAYLEGRSNEASSSAWVDHLVVHDDLLGPYYCISRADLFERATGRRTTLKPKTAIALLPQGVEVSPVQAEQTARSAFLKLVGKLQALQIVGGSWWDLLARPNGRRVYRTTLVTRDAYIASLRAGPFPGNTASRGREALGKYEANLPERAWLVEITLPQLYVGNRAGLGEVLIRVEGMPENDIEAVAGFRLPGLLAWAGSEPNEFIVITRFPIRGHRPLHAPLYHRNGW